MFLGCGRKPTKNTGERANSIHLGVELGTFQLWGHSSNLHQSSVKFSRPMFQEYYMMTVYLSGAFLCVIWPFKHRLPLGALWIFWMLQKNSSCCLSSRWCSDLRLFRKRAAILLVVACRSRKKSQHQQQHKTIRFSHGRRTRPHSSPCKFEISLNNICEVAGKCPYTKKDQWNLSNP